MIKRIGLLLLALLTGVVFLYLSRFWWLTDLWPRAGLLGIEELSPRGRLLRQWLRGTDFAPFELLIWAVGVFLILTWMQKLVDFIFPAPEPDAEDTHD